MKYVIHKNEHICSICNKPSVYFVIVNGKKICSDCYHIQQESLNPEINEQLQKLENNHLKNQEIFKKSKNKHKRKLFKNYSHYSRKNYAINGVTSICSGGLTK